MKDNEFQVGDIVAASKDHGPAPLPPRKPLVVGEFGRIVPYDTKYPALDWIADIQLAPNAQGYVPLICACALMFYALKEAKNDPKWKALKDSTREAIQEALSCAE